MPTYPKLTQLQLFENLVKCDYTRAKKLTCDKLLMLIVEINYFFLTIVNLLIIHI